LEYVDANVANGFMDIDLPHGGFVADLEEISQNFQFSISLSKIMLKFSFQFNISELAINFLTLSLICALKENDECKKVISLRS
jgi:hypothetical protein